MNDASSVKLTKLLTDHRNSYTHSVLAKAASEQSLSEKEMPEKRTNKTRAVRLPAYKSLKGMMHGFIDLVFEYEGKYYVCDYKSSHLGENFSDYNEEALNENIESNHYDLQYLIYSLALHRYLKASLPGYDAEKHFGGAYYLYLRGMRNNKDKTVSTTTEHYQNGVYFRDIDAKTLNDFDTLFSGKEAVINHEVKEK